MAQNDALTFLVKVMEDPNHGVSALVKQIEGKLQSITFNLKGDNIKIQGLQKALQDVVNNIKPVEIVKQQDIKSAVSAITQIKNTLDTAFSKVNGGNPFSGLMNSINQLIDKLEELRAVGDNISRNFGTQLGNAFADAVTKANKEISDLLSNIQKLNSAFSGEGSATKKSPVSDAKNAAQAAKEYENIAKQVAEIERVLSKSTGFAGLRTSELEATKRQLKDIQKTMEKIKSGADSSSVADVVIGNQLRALQTKARALTQELNEGIRNSITKEKSLSMYNDVLEKMKEIRALGRSADNAGLTSLKNEADRAWISLDKIAAELSKIFYHGKTSGGLTAAQFLGSADFHKAIAEYKAAKTQINNGLKESERVAMASNRRMADDEIKRLQNYYKQLNRLQSEGLQKAGNKDAYKNSSAYKEIEQAKQKLQEYIDKLKEAKQAGQSIGSINLGNFKAGDADAYMARLAQAQQAAVHGAQQHAQAQERMAQAIQKANQAGALQSQILSDLKSVATQYLSVWGAMDFVKNVAQITGELELQQKSLEVIIGSAGKAQELYSDIKGMSQMSPFTFQNLIKTTKQLAAFGVETKSLYSTMNMLSNIGAGLDVDVQRLVLAYGHIKSAGVLQGIQRRQLETAGVGITAELAKMYNEQYRRAGSDERVTAEDVFKRIKDRQVGFEDVEKVFQRLTGPGGKFENMQLKQYETLGGKLRNLQNNYNIMLDEIGKAHMDLLMGGVNALNSLMENWKKWAAIIKTVGAGLIAAKVAQAAFGKGWAANHAAMMEQRKMLLEQRAVAAANGSSASYGSVMLGRDYAKKINESSMTRVQKIQSALYADVGKRAANAILREQELDQVYRRRIIHLNTLANSASLNERITGRWGLALERLKWSANSFYATMRAGLVTLMTNPMTWIFAAVAGITALVSRYKELNRVASEMRDKMVEAEKEDIKGINEAFGSLPESINRRVEGGRLIVDASSIPENEIDNLMESLDEALQKYDPLYNGHLFDLEQMNDDKEKVKAMIEELNAAKIGKETAQGKAAMLAKGIADTGGLVLKDSFLEELKEFQDAYIDQQAQIEQLVSKWENNKFSLVMSHYDSELSSEKLIDLEKEIKEYYNVSEVTADLLREFLTNKVTQKEIEGWIEGADMRLNNKDLRSKVSALIKKYYEGVNPAIMSGIKELQKKDPTGKAGASFIQEMINQALNTEGFEIKDEKTKKAVSTAILAAINDAFTLENPEAAVAFQNGPIQEYITQMVNAQTDEFLALEKSKYGDINKMDPNTLKKDYSEFFQSLADEVANITANASNGEAVLNRYLNTVKNTWKAISQGGDVEVNLSTWQKKIKDALNLEKFDNIKTKVGIDVEANVDLAKFAEEARKKYKEIKETAENIARTVNIKSKMNLKFDVDVMLGDPKKLKEFYLALHKYYLSQVTKLFDEDAKANAESAKSLIDSLKPLLNFYKMEEATGYDFHSDSKSDKEAKKKAEKKKNDNAADKADRDEMDRIRKKIKLIQDLNKAYKQYRDLGYGELAALQKVQVDYEAEYEKGKRPFEFGEAFNDIKSIEDYSALLDKLRKEDIDNNKKLSAKSREELNREIMNARRDIINAGLRERSDKLLNDLNGELEQLSDQFSILRKIVESTGDRMEAVGMAGIGETGKENYSDFVRAYLDNELKQMEEEINKNAKELEIGPISLKDLDYEKIAKMDNNGIENYIKEVYGVDPTVDWVKGISEWAKAYRKAIRDENKAAAEAYAKAIAEDLEYEAQKRRIETSLEDEIAKIKASGASDESKERAIDIATARSDMKILELQNQYKRFFDGIFAEPLESMETFADEIRETYTDAMMKGAMTADDYAKKLMEINDVMEKAREESNKGWFEKGIFNTKSQEDITKKMLEEAQDKMSEGADIMQQGIKSGDFASVFEGALLWAEGDKLMKEANKRAKLLRDINGAVTTVDKVVQAMNKAFNYIYEAFDALGEGESLAGVKDYMDTLSTVSGHVKGAMDAFMSGDMIGAITEGIGSVFSLITGMSQAHDNRLQRSIEKIQFETEKMNNTLDTIKSLRERQMGYDNGAMRLMLANMYTQNGGNNAATQAMIEYYTRYSGGSGYEQQLKLLEEQRDKLMEIYNLEDSKKKKSKEDLEDYKKQIADLDEQIMFFAEDLAKELWGIDLKGWADQLGDALMTAFENGTSAASAFHDTVQDIMRNLVKSMLVTGVIEPALEKLQTKLFGKDGQGGIFDPDNPQGSIGVVLSELGNWFNTEGPALMDAANEFYNGADNMMRQTLGYGMRESEKSTNTVNSIQSAASEETMGIVAGYLSRISQDVSVQRIMQEMFVNGSWPDYVEQVTTANNSLTAIDRSTTAMMEMMRDGNGALYERVENVSRRLDNFANGIDKIYIN